MNFIARYYGTAPRGERCLCFVHADGLLVYVARGREAVILADLRGAPALREDVHPKLSYCLAADPQETTIIFTGGCACGSPLKRVTEKDAETYLTEHAEAPAL